MLSESLKYEMAVDVIIGSEVLCAKSEDEQTLTIPPFVTCKSGAFLVRIVGPDVASGCKPAAGHRNQVGSRRWPPIFKVACRTAAILGMNEAGIYIECGICICVAWLQITWRTKRVQDKSPFESMWQRRMQMVTEEEGNA